MDTVTNRKGVGGASEEDRGEQAGLNTQEVAGYATNNHNQKTKTGSVKRDMTQEEKPPK